MLGQVPIPGGVRLSLEVPAELAWFRGHFPTEPILPGVAQAGWAIALARAHFGFPADPPELDRIKFSRPVKPGARLELDLVRDRARPGRVSWQLYEAGDAVSSGRLQFADA